MKNIFIKTNVAVFLASLLVGCTGNYLAINSNPYEVTREQTLTDGYAVSAALTAICGTVVSTDVNTAQFTDCLLGGPMGGYYSTTGAFEKTIDNYNPTDDWTRVFMASDRIIPTLYSNLNELADVTDDPVTLSIAKIIKVMAMLRVTDTYGPIPYTQIGVGGKITVPYDSQAAVYDAMFADLDDAIAVLTENKLSAISPKADPVYDGTAVKWCRFANSIKLRMAMRIVYADQAKAQKFAEEAVKHEIGVFTSNEDGAFLRPIAFGDKGNPLYTAIKYNQPTGCQTGGDTHAAADIICYMNGYNDPRRSVYFVKSEFDGVDYAGIRVHVEKPALNSVGRKYSGVNISPSDPLLWMNAAEVAFLKAEAVAVFGFDMQGTAEEFYNEGIRLSFDQNGVSGYASYITDDENRPTAYIDPAGLNNYSSVLSNVTVKWDESADTAVKQERIIIQKWIANFNLGNEAWADWRRTGYPRLMPATDAGNKSDGIVSSEGGARRMPYPQAEYTNNGENVNAAVSELLGGPDRMSTRLWWDCNEAIVIK
ncbi:MAG: SusD/RagB family nutrient-binding outer membrane lipoprotein [Clostridium sp.]|nr:SusD/RagB family nutrient-binding outer membrane lipoprotein [Bacteroides sp.]MCM1197300.1 SusD/RagB family nutrient-binding outer membrane lipoprotein [Clostridium sp.]